jgi:hypothetical protein
LAQPILPLTWIIIAALLVTGPQPIFLALVAVAWGFSMIFIIPGVSLSLGSDPIMRFFSGSTVEIVVLTLVRLVLLVTAWNQFLFFRMLYGTEGASGIDPALPPIPPVIPNPAVRVAVWARLLGFLGLMTALLSVGLATSGLRSSLLAASYGGAVLAVGLGLGSAFVPNPRRAMSLWGVGLGCLALLAALLVGRALI